MYIDIYIMSIKIIKIFSNINKILFSETWFICRINYFSGWNSQRWSSKRAVEVGINKKKNESEFKRIYKRIHNVYIVYYPREKLRALKSNLLARWEKRSTLDRGRLPPRRGRRSPRSPVRRELLVTVNELKTIDFPFFLPRMFRKVEFFPINLGWWFFFVLLLLLCSSFYNIELFAYAPRSSSRERRNNAAANAKCCTR